MNQYRHLLFNYFVHLTFILILLGIESTLWFHLTEGAPSPMLWISSLLYFLLYRKPIEALICTYGLGLVITAYSAIPIGMIWITLLVVSLIILFIKVRVFWPSTRYFIVLSLVAAFLFHLVYFSLSQLLDLNPARPTLIFRLFEILQTPLWAAPIYWSMIFLDRITRREPLPESAGVEK